MPIFLLSFFARPFVKKFLPWIVGALVVLGIAWYVHHRYEAFKADLIQQGRIIGRDEMADVYRNTIKTNNDKNRSVDGGIASSMEKFKKDYDKKQKERISKENKAKSSIEKQIISHPDFYTNPICTLPPEMLTERNRIRALGPSE